MPILALLTAKPWHHDGLYFAHPPAQQPGKEIVQTVRFAVPSSRRGIGFCRTRAASAVHVALGVAFTEIGLGLFGPGAQFGNIVEHGTRRGNRTRIHLSEVHYESARYDGPRWLVALEPGRWNRMLELIRRRAEGTPKDVIASGRRERGNSV